MNAVRVLSIAIPTFKNIKLLMSSYVRKHDMMRMIANNVSR